MTATCWAGRPGARVGPRCAQADARVVAAKQVLSKLGIEADCEEDRARDVAIVLEVYRGVALQPCPACSAAVRLARITSNPILKLSRRERQVRAADAAYAWSAFYSVSHSEECPNQARR